jgi:predicted DNA-binding transcriptional regulator YafY
MNSHDTILRQWGTLRLIPRYPRKVTAREITKALAGQDFAVTKRTVERDLQALSEVFPLVCDEREKPYGWSWQKDAPSFDLPGLTATEALAMKLVEQYLGALLPASITEQLKPHFKTAESTLAKSPMHGRISAWTNKIRVVPPAQPLLPPKIKAEIQRAVYEALLQDRQIEAVYQKRGDPKPVKYTLQPLAIVQRAAVTYLASTIFNYLDVRLFAVHRFQSVIVLDAPVKRPEGFNLDEYIASGAFGFGRGKKIKLEALFTREAAEHLYETPLSADQVLRPQTTDHTKLVATVADTPQLAWWLLGFGEAVEVLGPAKLRATVAANALQMSRRYYRS